MTVPPSLRNTQGNIFYRQTKWKAGVVPCHHSFQPSGFWGRFDPQYLCFWKEVLPPNSHWLTDSVVLSKKQWAPRRKEQWQPSSPLGDSHGYVPSGFLICEGTKIEQDDSASLLISTSSASPTTASRGWPGFLMKTHLHTELTSFKTDILHRVNGLSGQDYTSTW